MVQNFLNVGTQVLVLFILIALGFLLNKLNLIKDNARDGINNIVLYAVTPCVIVKSFQKPFDKGELKLLLIAFLAAFCILLFSVFLGEIIFRKKEKDKAVILKFSCVFSNCGFMSLPLQEAVLGQDGVFFGAAFVAIFNLFMWTYGLIIMSGKKEPKAMAKAVINPGVIATIIAFILYVFNIFLPTVIYNPISFMAALNTPLPMILLGVMLATTNIKKAFTDKDCYFIVLIRLIFIPLIALFVLKLIGINGTLLVSLIISACSPVAIFLSIMASKFKRDTDLSVSIVTVSSILSLVTMPLIVGLTQYFA